MKIFISFVEEGIMNPEYQGYVGGRIEVYKLRSAYACEEIRFFTKDVVAFNIFRELWNMKTINKPQLDFIREYVELCFYDSTS